MPEWFLQDGELNKEVRDPTTIAFGFGRRHANSGTTPPGYQLTSSFHLGSVRGQYVKDHAFLTIATVLYVFDIVPSCTTTGYPSIPRRNGPLERYRQCDVVCRPCA